MLEKIFQSSQNQEKLSLTIKGILLSFVPVILVIIRGAGLEGVDTNFLTEFIENITIAMQQFFALVSTLTILWGLARKVVPAND